MFRLDGKVALVTGASRGIGRAAAKALAKQGATVVINYVQGQAAALEAVEQITTEGGQAEALQFDVADSAAVESAIESLTKRLGKLDILVANAGVAIDGLWLRSRDEDLDKMLDINLRGALACARVALRPMIRKRYGRLVFVSSIIGEMGGVGQTAYAATKAALLGATKSLAREYSSRNITVNAVAPGLIDTEMTARIDDERRKEIISHIPCGRLGTPEDVSHAIVYLCSDEAAYVTGHTLRINGGMLL